MDCGMRHRIPGTYRGTTAHGPDPQTCFSQVLQEDRKPAEESTQKRDTVTTESEATMSSQASLSAAADERKARLAKLKSLKRKQPSPSDDDDHDMSTATQSGGAEEPSQDLNPSSKDVARLHISGRNYDPETRGPKLGFEAPPVEGPTLEDKAAELEAEVRRKAEEEAAADRGIDLFKLQPKKPNWDLKRELNRKLEILNVRTDNAIARLVRERLEAKKAAASASGGKKTEGATAETDGGLEGTAIVEGLRMREREEAEEERREREELE